MINSRTTTKRPTLSLKPGRDSANNSTSSNFKKRSDKGKGKPQQDKATLAHESVLNDILNTDQKITVIDTDHNEISGTLIGYDAFTITVGTPVQRTLFKNNLLMFGPTEGEL